jgi:hypothetical protein
MGWGQITNSLFPGGLKHRLLISILGSALALGLGLERLKPLIKEQVTMKNREQITESLFTGGWLCHVRVTVGWCILKSNMGWEQIANSLFTGGSKHCLLISMLGSAFKK